MTRRRSMRNHGQQRGVGMIELLIALVIVAIGVLGVSRAQLGMVRANHNALLRAHANTLAYDMADRLRADRVAARAGAYDRALDDAVPTGTTLTALELANWLGALGTTLPAGTGGIARNGNNLTVTVRWDETRGQGAAQIFTVVTEL
jgi:type IV pilus assembly protein PilV